MFLEQWITFRMCLQRFVRVFNFLECNRIRFVLLIETFPYLSGLKKIENWSELIDLRNCRICNRGNQQRWFLEVQRRLLLVSTSALDRWTIGLQNTSLKIKTSGEQSAKQLIAKKRCKLMKSWLSVVADLNQKRKEWLLQNEQKQAKKPEKVEKFCFFR